MFGINRGLFFYFTTRMLSRAAKGFKPPSWLLGEVRWACTWDKTSCNASQAYIDRELQYGAWNYAPLPVIVDRGLGAKVWDVTGKEYFDFIGGIGSVNQGHSHPKLVSTMVQQASKLSLTSRAFYNSVLGEYEEYITKLFGYDKVLPMNTGVEACDTAIKIARLWGYTRKNVPKDQAMVLFPEQNYWGRSLAGISSSTNALYTTGFGPMMPGFDLVPYDDLDSLEHKFQGNPHIVAFMLEPILGEGGVIVPSDGYLKGVRNLCDKYDVLMIVDEVQTGLGRTGELLCHYHEKGVRPDLLTLGKALSGGMYPVSAVLGDDRTMMCLKPGSHGSTFGGNPLGSQIAKAALEILVEENIAGNAAKQGTKLRKALEQLGQERPDRVKDIRGKGLLQCLELHRGPGDTPIAWDACLTMKEKGLITRPVSTDAIRLAPTCVISDHEMDASIKIITDTVHEMPLAWKIDGDAPQ